MTSPTSGLSIDLSFFIIGKDKVLESFTKLNSRSKDKKLQGGGMEQIRDKPYKLSQFVFNEVNDSFKEQTVKK